METESRGMGLARAVFAIIVLMIMLTAGSATIFLMLYLLGFVGDR